MAKTAQIVKADKKLEDKYAENLKLIKRAREAGLNDEDLIDQLLLQYSNLQVMQENSVCPYKFQLILQPIEP